MTVRTHLAFAFAVITALTSTQCLAYDPIGTAGLIRSFGSGKCDLGYAAKQRGECDPPAVAANLPPDTSSRRRVERARQLINIARTDAALRELDTAIAEAPSNTSALVLRARLRIPAQGTEALVDLNKALEIDPDNSDAWATKAFIISDQDERDGMKAATKALASNPSNVDALWIRAIIGIRLGELEQAGTDLDRAVAIEPDNPQTLITRAELRLNGGNVSGAKDDVDTVLASSYDLRALKLRVKIRAASGDDVGALADLNTILGPPGDRPPGGAVRPDFIDLYVQRAIVLTRAGKLADAQRDLDAIVSFGGSRAILQMQVYLRGHGFPDLHLDGKRTDQLDTALQACFINSACGRGIAIRG